MESRGIAPPTPVSAGFDGTKLGRQDKSLASWPAYVVGIIESFCERPNTACQSLRQNVNDINARSAIRTPLGQERAGKRRGVPTAKSGEQVR